MPIVAKIWYWREHKEQGEIGSMYSLNGLSGVEACVTFYLHACPLSWPSRMALEVSHLMTLKRRPMSFAQIHRYAVRMKPIL